MTLYIWGGITIKNLLNRGNPPFNELLLFHLAEDQETFLQNQFLFYIHAFWCTIRLDHVRYIKLYADPGINNILNPDDIFTAPHQKQKIISTIFF